MRLKRLSRFKKKKNRAETNVPVCIYGPPEMPGGRPSPQPDFEPDDNVMVALYGAPVVDGELAAPENRPEVTPDEAPEETPGTVAPEPKKPFDPRRNVAMPLYGPPRGKKFLDK